MVFGTSILRGASKTKQKLVSLKQDMGLFSRLCIACQAIVGNLREVSQHKNQSCLQALSDRGVFIWG